MPQGHLFEGDRQNHRETALSEAEAHDPVLSDVFDSLRDAGVAYVALRNTEGLPHRLTGNDLDLLVSPSERKRAGEAVQRALACRGWVLLQDLQRPYIHAMKFGSRSDLASWPRVFHLDLFTGVGWRWCEIASAKSVLQHTVSHGTVPILPSGIEAAILILHHLLWTGRLHKTSYAESARNASREMTAEALRFMQDSVGSGLAHEAWDWARRGGPVDEALRHRARKVACARSAVRRPTRAASLLLRASTEEVRRRRHSQGRLVKVIAAAAEPYDELQRAVEWLSTLWRYNHYRTDRGWRSVVSAANVSLDDVRRACGSNEELTLARLRRLVARGWIIVVPDTYPGLENRGRDVLTVRGGALPGGGSAVSLCDAIVESVFASLSSCAPPGANS
jgi:hypothetical protein